MSDSAREQHGEVIRSFWSFYEFLIGVKFVKWSQFESLWTVLNQSPVRRGFRQDLTPIRTESEEQSREATWPGVTRLRWWSDWL